MPLILNTSTNPGTAQWSEIGAVQQVYFGGTGVTVAEESYYLDTDGAWKQTDGTTVTNAVRNLTGVAVGTDPAVDGMILQGLITMNTYLDNWSAGLPVWISATAGRLTTTKPAVAANGDRVVGWCTATANEIYYRPDGVWVTAP